MEASIRQARVDDCPALAALHLRTALFAYASIFPSEAPRPKLNDLTSDWRRRLGGLGSPKTRGYVAAAGDELVGVILAGEDPDYQEMGNITRFYVDVSHWGQGVGRLLYESAISDLRRVPYEQASLWVLEDNIRARSWYQRLGWVCTGERKTAGETAGVEDVRYVRDIQGLE